MNINLHIERLVLEGLPLTRSQGALVQAAIEVELAQLISDHGLSPIIASNAALPRVPASSIQLTGDSNPTRIGQQIANSLFTGLGHERPLGHTKKE